MYTIINACGKWHPEVTRRMNDMLTFKKKKETKNFIIYLNK